MKKILTLIIFFCIILSSNLFGQTLSSTKLIHVFVALCDNGYQGIVRVPESIGDGKNPRTNLYWGAGYGVKSYFNLKTDDWELVSSINSNNKIILERLLFKHKSKNVFMLADAYDGEQIKTCILDYLKSANGQNIIQINNDSLTLNFGGGADLLAYVGHNGLMDFDIELDYETTDNKKKHDVILLACYSKGYFNLEIKKAGANPLLWTTHLMAPEAYTLKSAIDGWLENETGEQIEERAAQTYNKYQKCGINGARNLFTSGF